MLCAFVVENLFLICAQELVWAHIVSHCSLQCAVGNDMSCAREYEACASSSREQESTRSTQDKGRARAAVRRPVMTHEEHGWAAGTGRGLIQGGHQWWREYCADANPQEEGQTERKRSHRRRMGLQGVRVGKAKNPGPDELTVISHNVHGLENHTVAALKTRAHIYAWQEVEVSAHTRREIKDDVIAMDYKLHLGWSVASGAQGMKKTRAAIACHQDVKAYPLVYDDGLTVELLESGRWVERLVPVRDGSSFIIVASLYGVSGASGDPALTRRNDKLTATAIHRAGQFVTTPYYLCCDLNQDPQDSAPVQTALEAGVVTDVVLDWAKNTAELEPTYRHDGVFKGMNGPGTSRIDAIFANAVGQAAVARIETVWDMAMTWDHTPLKLTLDIQAMTQTVLRADRPIGIKTELHYYRPPPGASADRKKQLEESAAKGYQAVAKVYQQAFDEAIRPSDVQEAHSLWCLMAELFLYLSQDVDQGRGPEVEKFLRRGVPRRGQSMPVKPQQLAPSIDEGADAGVIGTDELALQVCASCR